MLPNILQIFDLLSKRFFEPFISLLRVLWTHYRHFPLFLVLSVIRLFVIIVQRIKWRRNGLAHQFDRIWNGMDYERSAQVLDVWWSCKATPTDKPRFCQFLTTHREFTHPKYVLSDDCVLAEVTPEYAVFFQMPHPMSAYSAKTATFLWYTLPYDAIRLIIMPMTTFQRFSMEIGPPKDGGGNVVFLWGSGRCGSTLIAKMIDAADDDCLVLSEPPILMDLYYWKQLMRPQAYMRLCESCMRFLVRPVTGKKKIFIKPIFFSLNLAEDVHLYLPNARFLYSYRKPLRTIWAHERAFGGTPHFRLMHLFMTLTNEWEWGARLIGYHRNAPMDYHSRRILGKSTFDMCTVIWGDNYERYMNVAKRIHFPAILYERLFDNPHKFCSELLAFCGVDLSRVQYALDLLTGDSQEGSLFSQSLLRGLSVTPFTPELKTRTDRFCDIMNLPRLELEVGLKRFNLSTLDSWSCSTSKVPCTSSQDSNDGHSFITAPEQTLYEIAHAGFGSEPASKPSQYGSNGLHKTATMKPYYKPLPLQIIYKD